MNNLLLAALGFFGLGALATFLTVIRIRRRDMSTSGMGVTPNSNPAHYRLELVIRALGCLFFYAVSIFGVLKYLDQK